MTDLPAPTPVAKITVPLSFNSASTLLTLSETTGMTRADLVNRAIGLLDFVTSETDSGSTLLIRRPDGDTYRVEIF